MPYPFLDQIIALREVNLLLSSDKVFQDRVATPKKQRMNKSLFGVKFPSAIAEALLNIKTTPNGIRSNLNNVLVKIDTGASVSLAHPDYLTGIKDCRLQGLAPVRLNGIGGRTNIISKVGMLNIIRSDGEITKIKCYAFDVQIGDTTHLCLLSNWAIDHFRIDLVYHTHTSLRHGPQRLRFAGRKPQKAIRLQNKRGHRISQGMLVEEREARKHAQGKRPIRAQVRENKDRKRYLAQCKNIQNRAKTARAAPIGASVHFAEKPDAQNIDPLDLIREYVKDYPILTAGATEGKECNCGLRYAPQVSQETYKHDGGSRPREPEPRC